MLTGAAILLRKNWRKSTRPRPPCFQTPAVPPLCCQPHPQVNDLLLLLYNCQVILKMCFLGSEATPPVEFSTTPPNHVYKPRRSTSPHPCIEETPPSEEPHLELRSLDERKERRAISSKRRYRQSRIHHIQRPCLDFEKMQLVS